MMKLALTLGLIASLSLVLLIVSWGGDEQGPLRTSIMPQSLSDFELSGDGRERWSLPASLAEISGLAIASDNLVLAHNDELAVVYSIAGADVVPRFQLSEPALSLDLEGIALLGDDLFMVTSTGELYYIQDWRQHRGVMDDYQVIETGLRSICEVEGLSESRTPGLLVLACKQMINEEDRVAVFSFDPATSQLTRLFDVSFEVTGKIFPSAITPAFGGYLLLSARDRLILQVTEQGEVVAQTRLKKSHNQPEGVGLFSDGRLVIADEGGKGNAQLSIYSAFAD